MKIVYLIIHLVVPLWILIGVTGPYASQNPNLLAIGVLFVFIYVPSLIATAISYRKWMTYYRNVAKCTFFDVSHEQRPLPENAQHFLPILDQLGFTRMGEILRKMPSQPDQLWFVFGQADGLITAEVIPMPKQTLVAFLTSFADRASLETDFPVGEDLSTPYSRTVTVKADKGLAGAYQVHQQAGKEMMRQHGTRVAVKSLQEHLTRTEYNQQHHAVSINNIIHHRNLWALAPNVYVAVWILLLGLLLAWFGGYKPAIGYVMMFLYLLLPILIFTPPRFIH
ncbi:MAG: hypothetical protein K8L91_26475 [Anaerolineae bacterium]|nr:hypothetical protein [Anaerolineae bacterium]